MKNLILTVLMVIGIAGTASAEVSGSGYAQANGTCTAESCPPGTKVKVSLVKGDSVFACETEAQTNYTNFVLGMVSFMHEMTGRLPNISPSTGEPEVKGESKDMLDKLREQAGVKTFDEAVDKCLTEKKVNKKSFMVLNIKSDSDYAWIGSKSSKLWIPITAIKPEK